ncbi:unnamed protein product [Prorocentrum cordatum]|uniref:Uncharacterized protein n=1 Tax=Prorocentrum cordatum TaxID=2364126 RepID=A0ABN9TDH8_9DINO|nr:unnamed protein product [Polarella glacialis]
MLSGKTACAECHATWARGNFDGEGALEDVIQKCSTEPPSDQLFNKANTIRVQKHLGEEAMETERGVGRESHKPRIVETRGGHLKSAVESGSGKSFKELRLTQTPLPSADLRAARPGVLTKSAGVKCELVRQRVASKDTFNMSHSSQMHRGQGANVFKKATQQWTSAFVRRPRNTTIGDGPSPSSTWGVALRRAAATVTLQAMAWAQKAKRERGGMTQMRSVRAASAAGASARSPDPKRSPSGGMSVLQREPGGGGHERCGATWGTSDAEEKAALENLAMRDPVEALMDQRAKVSERWARGKHKKRADADPGASIATHIQKRLTLMARRRAASLDSPTSCGNRGERAQDIKAAVMAKVEFPIARQVAVVYRALEDISRHAIVGSPDEVVSRWRGAFSGILRASVRLAEGGPNSQAVAAAVQLEDVLVDLDVCSDPSHRSCPQKPPQPIRCLICVFDCSRLEFYDDAADALRAARAGGLAVNDARRAVADAMDKPPAYTARLEDIEKGSRAAQQHSEPIIDMCEAIADETKTHPPQQLSEWLDMLMNPDIGRPEKLKTRPRFLSLSQDA